MADTNLNIIVRVEGAKEAAVEIHGIGTATEGVGKQTDETAKKTRALRSTLSTLATGFLVYKGAQWIKGAVTQTTELAKSTYGLSKITGMDVHTAGGWVALAKERGIQSRQLNMAFLTLNKQTVKLAEGNKTAAKTFAEMGITAKQWAGLNVEQRIERVATAFQHMHDPAQRSAAAQALFGRGAQAMIPLLSKGSAAIRAQVAEQAKAAGESRKTITEQLKLVAQQREMNRAMLQLKVAVATALMPILVSFTKILAPITSAFAELMQHSGVFRVAVIALSAAFVVFIGVMKLARLAEIDLLAGAAPWLALAVGLGVVFYMLYTKVKWFRDAVNAVWSWIKANWPLLVGILLMPFVGPLGIIVGLFHKQLLGAIKEVWSWIKSAWHVLGPILEAPFKLAWEGIKGFLNLLISAINIVIEGLDKIHVKVPSWVPGLGGQGFGISIPTVPHLAEGGIVTRAGSALVGERGPEVVELAPGARVAPLPRAAAASARPAIIQVPVFLDRRQIALAMGTFVADSQATR